ncbi:MAG: DHH family phosphoesterase, partial [Spirochaetia bacterium]
MHKPIPEELLRALHNFSKFVIVGHEEPDGDCLSSQKALASYLSRCGADIALVSPGPFTRNEISHLSVDFALHIPIEYRDSDTLTVILDCSTLDRIGYLSQELGDAHIAVIDHHASGKTFGG